MKKKDNYIKSSLEELTQVTWPTKNQAIRLSIIVLVVCVIIAALLGVLDMVFDRFYKFLLQVRA